MKRAQLHIALAFALWLRRRRPAAVLLLALGGAALPGAAQQQIDPFLPWVSPVRVTGQAEAYTEIAHGQGPDQSALHQDWDRTTDAGRLWSHLSTPLLQRTVASQWTEPYYGCFVDEPPPPGVCPVPWVPLSEPHWQIDAQASARAGGLNTRVDGASTYWYQDFGLARSWSAQINSQAGSELILQFDPGKTDYLTAWVSWSGTLRLGWSSRADLQPKQLQAFAEMRVNDEDGVRHEQQILVNDTESLSGSTTAFFSFGKAVNGPATLTLETAVEAHLDATTSAGVDTDWDASTWSAEVSTFWINVRIWHLDGSVRDYLVDGAGAVSQVPELPASWLALAGLAGLVLRLAPRRVRAAHQDG